MVGEYIQTSTTWGAWVGDVSFQSGPACIALVRCPDQQESVSPLQPFQHQASSKCSGERRSRGDPHSTRTRMHPRIADMIVTPTIHRCPSRADAATAEVPS